MTKCWTSTLFPTADHSHDQSYLPICWCATEKQYLKKYGKKMIAPKEYEVIQAILKCSNVPHTAIWAVHGYLGQSLQAWHRSWSRRRPRRGPQSGYRGCRSVWWSSPSVCWGRSTRSSTHTRLFRENGVEKHSTVNSLKRRNVITFQKYFYVSQQPCSVHHSRLKCLNNYWIDGCEIFFRHS